MNFLWPERPDPEPSLIARMGRVLHWGLAGIAAILAMVAIGLGLENRWEGAAGTLATGVGCWFFARALRYILSGE